MTLNRWAAVQPPILDDAAINMRLPVLPPFGISSQRSAEDFGARSPSLGLRREFRWSSLKPFSALFSKSVALGSNA